MAGRARPAASAWESGFITYNRAPTGLNFENNSTNYKPRKSAQRVGARGNQLCLRSANALSSCWLESNLPIAGGTPGRGADPGAGCACGDGCAGGGGAAFNRLMALSIRWLESYRGGGDGLDGDGLEVGSGSVLVELSLSSSRLEPSRNELYRVIDIDDHSRRLESGRRTRGQGELGRHAVVQVYLAVKPVGVTTPFPTRRLRIYQS